ncbi:MAG: hypothetical protein KC496_22110, partial [Anaerolineae bacterium]|nr:hypothetical protein [Anaerolineae bacterium]
MSIFAEARPSDSSYVESVSYGGTRGSGVTVRPAEVNWHLVFTRVQGKTLIYAVGPWRASGEIAFGAGAEIL